MDRLFRIMRIQKRKMTMKVVNLSMARDVKHKEKRKKTRDRATPQEYPMLQYHLFLFLKQCSPKDTKVNGEQTEETSVLQA